MGETTWMFCCASVLRWVFAVWKQRYFCILLLVCSLLLPVKTDSFCPSPCVCANDSGTVTCVGGDDNVLPSDIPEWATTVIVRGNNVSTLPAGFFSSNGTERELNTLSLSFNGIENIEAYAFVGLPRLHLLDLSHNRLVFISARAFHGLKELRSLCLNGSLTSSAVAQLSRALLTESLSNLHRLELSGNQLKTIPLARIDIFNLHALVLTNNSIETIGKENVSRLFAQKRLRVHLSLNPFRCNCELEGFYYWLKNSSQCPDAGRLLCAEPESRRGLLLERLRPEDVDCIKRWINNIREACRDQMEVYHYRYEQDSDPRLANVAV
ncbi:trophoblast glycoprotein-like [Aplochiton taeniatus]